MKQFLKLKFKMHSLVNYLFYLIIFLLGCCVGSGFNFTYIKENLSSFLFIDNVEALTTDQLKTGFESYYNLDINNYSNVICGAYNYNTTSVQSYFCYFMSDDSYDSTYISNVGDSSVSSSKSRLSISSNNNWSNGLYRLWFNSDGSLSSTTQFNVYYSNLDYDLEIQYPYTHLLYTSFSFSDLLNHSVSFGKTNYYLYNKYTISDVQSAWNSHLSSLEFVPNYVFNDSLFDNNTNFKKVCLNSDSKFSITNNTFHSLSSVSDYDYLWFKGVFSGYDVYNYNSEDNESTILSVVDYDDIDFDNDSEIDYYQLNFYSDENINNISDVDSTKLSLKDYENLELYYGYTALPFNTAYNGDSTNPVYSFNIFKFNNPSQISLDCYLYPDNCISSGGGTGSFGSGNGGGGFRDSSSDDEDDITEAIAPSEICFYINNRFNVNIVNSDDWNDDYGDISFGSDTYSFHSTTNSSSVDTSRLFSTLNDFLSQIHSTISFINSEIYLFYTSLPLIVRKFILSCIILVVLKIVIDMIVR